MMTTALRVHRMTRDDMEMALRWAAREGWNPGLGDAEAFHPIDPKGCLMAWVDRQPVGCITALRYSASYGFIGLYIVDPGHRGQGIGRQIRAAALNHLKGCVVGLDAVPARQEDYSRQGFDAAWHNVRFQTRGRTPPPHNPRIVSLTARPFDLLGDYDKPFHPEPRPAFLQRWVRQRHAWAVGWLQDGALRGYGVVRPCVDGHKIGPLCADAPAIADALLQNLMGQVPVQSIVSIDVPEPNREAIALVERHCLAAGFPTVRMFRGPAPKWPLSRLYGLTALEIG